MRARLDATDWRILKELVADGRVTNVALAARVGMSAPQCFRRMRALEERGVIMGYHARLDERLTGFEVTAFAMVHLTRQAETELRAFENLVLAWPLVREAHMVSGDFDYLLKCVAPDMPAFQEFILGTLTTAANVASVKTTLALRPAKHEPGPPIGARRRERD